MNEILEKSNELMGEGRISLKEAAKILGYAPDYVGQLIRQGKIDGKQVYCNVAWVTTEGALREYVASNERKKKEEYIKKLERWDVRTMKELVCWLESAEGVRTTKKFFYTIFGIIACIIIFLFYVLATSVDYRLQQQIQYYDVERS